MVETTRTGNPFFDAWMDAGRRFMEGGFAPAPAMDAGLLSELASRAEENWQLCQRQAADWAKASSRWLDTGARDTPAEGIAEETDRKSTRLNSSH